MRRIFAAIPEQLRRPLYVTEFGVRGLRTFEGELTFDPGFYPDGTGIAATTKAAFQEAWLMIRATQLGYVAAAKWDIYDATYDIGTQDFSAIGPGVERLDDPPCLPPVAADDADDEPGRRQHRRPCPDRRRRPGEAGDGVHCAVGRRHDPRSRHRRRHDRTRLGSVSYRLGGLPPNTRFRLLVWNADGSGTNIEIGFVDTDSNGTIEFSVPLQGVFALTTVPLGSLPW